MPKQQRRGRPLASTGSQFMAGLSQAEALMRRKRWTEARELLATLDQRYPNRAEVLTALVNVAYELQDTLGYESASERLSKLQPDDPDVTLGLAGARLLNGRPVLALRTFRRFLEHWPNHDRAAEVRTTVAGLEANMGAIIAEVGLSGDDGLEIAALHEQAQSLMESGNYVQARTVAEQLLRQHPTFAPALNNVSLTYALEGRLDRAIATAERVLEFDPDNVHALANLTRYLCLSGRSDEATQRAAQLKVSDADAVDGWVKKAEALSYLGDDQGVLDAFTAAERTGYLKAPGASPLLYHLAAVAYMRRGDTAAARRLWRQTLKLSPGFDLAQANLDDLRQSVGERHAPWPFSLSYWISQDVAVDLALQAQSAIERGGEAALARVVQRFLRKHPEIAGLVPLLLDRGDPQGRQFALQIAMTAETPELLADLHDFALSQRGPDALRLQAAQRAGAAGLFPPGLVRLWIKGEWQELMLLNFEIHDEIVQHHQPQVETWLAEATTLLHEENAAKAEQLLNQALEVEPDAPDLLNNLAAAYEQQGRTAEAEALLRQNHERHPDYLFASTGLARLHLRNGDTDAARALLDPLLARRRFHFSEMAAVCGAEIELHLAEGNPAAARSWFDMWASGDPDNPDLERYRQQLRRPARRRLLERHR